MTDDLITLRTVFDDSVATLRGKGNVPAELLEHAVAQVFQLLAQPAGSGGAPASPQGWMPIEDCPNDVAVWICYAVGEKGMQKVRRLPAKKNSYSWKRDDGYRLGGLEVPTHFQLAPAPAPPSSGDGRGVEGG